MYKILYTYIQYPLQSSLRKYLETWIACTKELKVLRLYIIAKRLAKSNFSPFDLIYVLKCDENRVGHLKGSEYVSDCTSSCFMSKQNTYGQVWGHETSVLTFSTPVCWLSLIFGVLKRRHLGPLSADSRVLKLTNLWCIYTWITKAKSLLPHVVKIFCNPNYATVLSLDKRGGKIHATYPCRLHISVLWEKIFRLIKSSIWDQLVSASAFIFPNFEEKLSQFCRYRKGKSTHNPTKKIEF